MVNECGKLSVANLHVIQFILAEMPKAKTKAYKFSQSQSHFLESYLDNYIKASDGDDDASAQPECDKLIHTAQAALAKKFPTAPADQDAITQARLISLLHSDYYFSTLHL
ncbi:hypothetical protein QCA50_016965 [Cerrena zonata]|uniref:Uncharacterized protein n=1 Tax=Cerrena zonata TaxID=2478898 RepID=A0AAW0FP40_9APHY